MRRMVLRSLVLVSVVLSLTSLAVPVSAGPLIDLPRVPIVYDYATPLESHGYWVGTPRGGEWRVVGSQLRGQLGRAMIVAAGEHGRFLHLALRCG